MIAKSTLKILLRKRLLDSKVLLANRRYFASIYIAGYALELALKYRICSMMQFNRGFPESKAEFNTYYSDTRKVLLRTTIREIRDIRHHKLSLLLRYSGEQVNIEKNFTSAWDCIKNWNPEMRYTDPVVRKQKARDFLTNCRIVINEIS
jgi:hypothetical protein